MTEKEQHELVEEARATFGEKAARALAYALGVGAKPPSDPPPQPRTYH